MKVYLLKQTQGSYDDYFERVIGIYKDKKDADEKALELDSKCLNVSDRFPMTMYDYCINNYGFDEDDETRIDIGGYTVADFELMDELVDLQNVEYHPCLIIEYELI